MTTVTGAKEALLRLDAGERFDLILCDLMMPEMSGMDLHRRLQQSAPDQAAKIRFMTGGAFTEITQAFLAQLNNESIEEAVQGGPAARTGPPAFAMTPHSALGGSGRASAHTDISAAPAPSGAMGVVDINEFEWNRDIPPLHGPSTA